MMWRSGGAAIPLLLQLVLLPELCLASLRVTLIRHGETEWNSAGRLQGSSDSPLTEGGVRGAVACGQRLSTWKFDAAYTSPLPRARRTATLILNELQSPPHLQEDDRLRERCFGRWEGLEWSRIEEEFGEELSRSNSDASYAIQGGGESRQETLERVLAFLNTLPEKYTRGKSASVLCVTHSATATSIIKDVLGLAQEQRRSFYVRNCAINEIEYDFRNGRWVLATLGDCAHLELSAPGTQAVAPNAVGV
jgi:broad specificity phosphatase PhoE